MSSSFGATGHVQQMDAESSRDHRVPPPPCAAVSSRMSGGRGGGVVQWPVFLLVLLSSWVHSVHCQADQNQQAQHPSDQVQGRLDRTMVQDKE